MIVAGSRLAAFLSGIALALPCGADSFASSASSAGSASVGSLSDSLTSSSGSSTRNVAEGDYRIVEVVAAARADALRLKLQPVANERDPAAAIFLEVPRSAVAARAVVPGGVVGVRQRPYGYEFAWADTRVAFFLALAPEWHRELDSKPL